MLDDLREDLRRACVANQHEQSATALFREFFNPGTQAVIVYRFGAWIGDLRIPGVSHLLKILHFALQYFFAWRVGIFIPTQARIGPGLVIHTWGGGVFLPRTKIGRNLTVIGGGIQMDYEVREIGDDVDLGPGTKVVGKVRIGNRARTGPNSVVQTDVPDDCVVFGNPGRVIGPVRKLSYDEGAQRIVPTARSGARSDSASPASQETSG